MPIYLYKGYDIKSGANRKGKIEADSLRAARQKLRSKDKVIASEIKEEVALKKGDKSASGFSLRQEKVTLPELAIMTRQFATLQRAHVPLDECLVALTNQVENRLLSNTLSAVKGSVSEGKSLAEAMHSNGYPRVFSRLYINMVKAGESSGNLGLVLERLADFLEYQVAIRGKIFSALTYPALMITASLGIIAYLFVSVVPKLEKVFISLRVTLPPFTKLLMDFSKFLQNQWVLVIVVAGVLYFLFASWYRTEKGKRIVDKLSLQAPILGDVVLRVNVSKFTKTLSTLLSSGVPIIAALEITKNIINNSLIANVLEESKIAVQEGEALWVPIERSKRFPALVTYMIRTGERTGELEQMLRHVADAYDAEVERKIDSLISLIEPLMIIVMGVIVVGVVMALLIPMLSVMNQVR